MARITVEDCLKKIPNRFQMVLTAAYRARQISQGYAPKVDCNSSSGFTERSPIRLEFRPDGSALRTSPSGRLFFPARRMLFGIMRPSNRNQK